MSNIGLLLLISGYIFVIRTSVLYQNLTIFHYDNCNNLYIFSFKDARDPNSNLTYAYGSMGTFLMIYRSPISTLLSFDVEPHWQDSYEYNGLETFINVAIK